MDLIKGLENGFCHTWVEGLSKRRNDVFKKEFKQYVDADKFIRDIQDAPRDARYKIDHYYKTTERDTVKYPYINSILHVLKILNIDETFNWKIMLKDNKTEYTHDDFTIGYCDYKHHKFENTFSGYYFKYKGKINTLKFVGSSELVNYNDPFWAEYKDKEQYYNSVSDLLYQIKYFLEYNKKYMLKKKF